MGEKITKVALVAADLGLTVKTVYNWINSGKLEMPRPGYVNYIDAWEVYLQQKEEKSIYSSLAARYGITRDSNGRFVTRAERGE